MPLDASHFHFYTFGWNGKLDQRKREDAAFKLYDQLIAEIKQLKQKIKPAKLVIEILAHSHGGNVALNLAKAEGTHKKRLAIDRLMLFGIRYKAKQPFIGLISFQKSL
jgi:alpha-beta hydrolase superfamily lysophospholipase